MKKKQIIKQNIIWDFNLYITSKYIGKRVFLYNGRKFFSFLIRENMIGFKFCEFVPTKRIGRIHLKKSMRNLRKR